MEGKELAGTPGELSDQNETLVHHRVSRFEKYWELQGRGDFCIKGLKIPRVTHGEDLCKHPLGSPMGRIYAKRATGYSWEGIMQLQFA